MTLTGGFLCNCFFDLYLLFTKNKYKTKLTKESNKLKKKGNKRNKEKKRNERRIRKKEKWQ